MDDDDLDARIRSGKALSESMGNFHVTGWDRERKVVTAAFTVRREYCHTNGTIAQKAKKIRMMLMITWNIFSFFP